MISASASEYFTYWACKSSNDIQIWPGKMGLWNLQMENLNNNHSNKKNLVFELNYIIL